MIAQSVFSIFWHVGAHGATHVFVDQTRGRAGAGGEGDWEPATVLGVDGSSRSVSPEK